MPEHIDLKNLDETLAKIHASKTDVELVQDYMRLLKVVIPLGIKLQKPQEFKEERKAFNQFMREYIFKE